MSDIKIISTIILCIIAVLSFFNKLLRDHKKQLFDDNKELSLEQLELLREWKKSFPSIVSLQYLQRISPYSYQNQPNDEIFHLMEFHLPKLVKKKKLKNKVVKYYKKTLTS